MEILIVDDSPTSRMLLKTVLGKLGYGVVVAADGDDALAKLERADSPDLVILDWMMPGLDGPEVCRRYGGCNPPGKSKAGLRNETGHLQLMPTVILIDLMCRVLSAAAKLCMV